MASTRFTFRQLTAKIGDSIVIPHADAGSVQIFESDLLSAGSGQPEWSVCFAIVEPMTKEQEKQHEKEQQAEREELQKFVAEADEAGIEQAAQTRGWPLPMARLRYEQAQRA